MQKDQVSSADASVFLQHYIKHQLKLVPILMDLSFYFISLMPPYWVNIEQG